jgi:hypothetical protein
MQYHFIPRKKERKEGEKKIDTLRGENAMSDVNIVPILYI